MKKRIFLVFICLCMVVFTFPVTAFAQDVDDLLADPVCTCETQCTEDAVDENCPVCSAGGGGSFRLHGRGARRPGVHL